MIVLGPHTIAVRKPSSVEIDLKYQVLLEPDDGRPCETREVLARALAEWLSFLHLASNALTQVL